MAGHDDGCTDSTNNMRWCGCASRGDSDDTGSHPGGEDALWRVALAEGCGTALLVLLTCLATCSAAATDSPLQRALASGFIVTLLVQCLAHVSGAQLNPTVTLAALVWGRMSRRRALLEALAQLVGAALGAGVHNWMQPADSCATLPIDHFPIHQAVVVEAVLGGCLALANCAAWDERNAGVRDSWPLRNGLSIAGLVLVAGEHTGASINPARSFGPALWSGKWINHWVYWVGPLSGSLLFTSLYKGAWRPHPSRFDVMPHHSERDVSDAPPLPGKTHAKPWRAAPLWRSERNISDTQPQPSKILAESWRAAPLWRSEQNVSNAPPQPSKTLAEL